MLVRIREQRVRRGWSQVQLAEAAGLSQPTVSAVEGGADTSTATLRRIAEALGCEVVDLLGRAGDAAPPAP